MVLPNNTSETYPLTLYAQHSRRDSSFTLSTQNIQDNAKPEQDALSRQISRTPSPTPSEVRALNHDKKTGIVQFFNPKNWRRYKWHWLGLAFGLTFVVLMSVYHEDIVRWLQPAAVWMHDAPGGWLIPIAILVVLSFPPLFGHELVAVLCGLVWGPWIGFGIVAAGTFIGEITNYYVFRYLLTARAAKYEKKTIFYACLAQVIRDGGFWIALVARYSAIPPHFTTTIFSTCGMGILVFTTAAFFSLPKQFANVYLGVLMGESIEGGSRHTSRVVTAVILTITILVTILAMRYILNKIKQIQPQVIYQRRKERQHHLSSTTTFSKESTGASFETVGKMTTVYKLAIPPARSMSREQLVPQALAADEAFNSDVVAPKPRILNIPTAFPVEDYDPYDSFGQEDVEMGLNTSVQHMLPGSGSPPCLPQPQGHERHERSTFS